jgi:hypothetical protein
VVRALSSRDAANVRFILAGKGIAEEGRRRRRDAAPRSSTHDEPVLGDEFASYHLQPGAVTDPGETSEVRHALAGEIEGIWRRNEIELPALAGEDATVNPTWLPDTPVASWTSCPICSGNLVVFDGMTDCIDCRRIWCDPGILPILG